MNRASQVTSVQFSSDTQSCLTLCDPMNCSTPGLPVHHQFPEFTQTHVHQVSDAIQPSHPLSSPSPALSLSTIRDFSNESALRITGPKYSSFSFDISPTNEHPGFIPLRMDSLDLLAVQGMLKSLFQHHSSKASILLRIWDAIWETFCLCQWPLPRSRGSDFPVLYHGHWAIPTGYTLVGGVNQDPKDPRNHHYMLQELKS